MGWTIDDVQNARAKIAGGKGQRRAPKEKRAESPTSVDVAGKSKPRYGKKARVRFFLPRVDAIPDRQPQRVIGIDPALKNNGVAERYKDDFGAYRHRPPAMLDSYELTRYLQDVQQWMKQTKEYALVLVEDAEARSSGNYNGEVEAAAYYKLSNGLSISEAEHHIYRRTLMGSGYAKSASRYTKMILDHLRIPYAMLPPGSTKASLTKGIEDEKRQQQVISQAVKAMTGYSGKHTHHVYDAVMIVEGYKSGGWKLFMKQLLQHR